MSYQRFCENYGEGFIRQVLEHTNLDGTAEWVAGYDNANLESAIRLEFSGATGTWLDRQVYLGSRLRKHEFSKDTFRPVTWRDVLSHITLFRKHPEGEELIEVLKAHGHNIPDDNGYISGDTLLPHEIGGGAWKFLLNMGITTRDKLRRACNAYGTLDITGMENQQMLISYLESQPYHVILLTNGDNQCLHVKEWAQVAYNFLDTPISFLSQLDRVDMTVVPELSKHYNTLREWKKAGYLMSIYTPEDVAVRLRLLAEEINCA